MKPNFNHPFVTGTRDYAKDLAAMKRSAEKAKIDPAFRLKLFQANPMFNKAGKLKLQFR
jgi:hypothetical protein